MTVNELVKHEHPVYGTDHTQIPQHADSSHNEYGRFYGIWGTIGIAGGSYAFQSHATICRADSLREGIGRRGFFSELERTFTVETVQLFTGADSRRLGAATDDDELCMECGTSINK
ncbi:MAG: hypothetical protein KAS66_14800 [Candidatus Omnitrophica bacterium]|nr:hypothetical protein [Candidatus Omnitrophota bacterium]